MTIPELIEMFERRLVFWQMLRTAANVLGDIERLATLDSDIAIAETTLAKLRAIPE